MRTILTVALFAIAPLLVLLATCGGFRRKPLTDDTWGVHQRGIYRREEPTTNKTTDTWTDSYRNYVKRPASTSQGSDE